MRAAMTTPLLIILAGLVIAVNSEFNRQHPACFLDRLQFCGRTTGFLPTLQCLAQHESQLSSSCQASLVPSPLFHCSDDLALICHDDENDHLQLVSCLWQHRNDRRLSSKCKAAGDPFHCSYRICKSDKERLCKDVHGLIPVMACLVDHEPELSPQCRKVVDHCPAFQCAYDAERICPETNTRREFLKCIWSNKDKLSDHCKLFIDPTNSSSEHDDAMDRHRRGHDNRRGHFGHGGRRFLKKCRCDLGRFCDSAEGMLEKMSCLDHHKQDLCPQCKQIVTGCPAFDCADDVIKFCPEAKTKDQFTYCLWVHRKELSDKCWNQNPMTAFHPSTWSKVGPNAYADLGEYTLIDDGGAATSTDQAPPLLRASVYESWLMSPVVLGVTMALSICSIIGIMYMCYRYTSKNTSTFENLTAYHRI